MNNIQTQMKLASIALAQLTNREIQKHGLYDNARLKEMIEQKETQRVFRKIKNAVYSLIN